MEVNGRTESPNNETVTDLILCESCQGDGKTVHAEGYCETCNECICSSCITAHRQLTLTKNHLIKSKDEMPSEHTLGDPYTELCSIHRAEIVKFYCNKHDCVGCGDCMVLEHKSCKIQLVADVSSNYGNSEELIRIKHQIGHMTQNLTSCKLEIDRSLKEAEEKKFEVFAKIKAFRKDLNNYLDKIEAELLEKVEEMKARDFSLQKKLQDQCEVWTSEMKEFQRKLDHYSERVNQLFITSKLVQKRLQKCLEINQDIASKSQINICEFEPSKDLTALQMKQSPIGNLSTQIKQFAGPSKKSIIEMMPHSFKKVKVQTANEIKCWISGMAVIAPDEILLGDVNNSSLKIMNARKGKVTSRFKLPDQPWDVTVINSDLAATTLPLQGKVLFVSIKSGLSESHSLTVRKGCRGIDYNNGIMAVSFCLPSVVQLLDIQGHILQEISDSGIFKYPHYITMSNDNESIFMSDKDNHSLYELTTAGHLKATIKSENITYPAGLTLTSNGTVVVCGTGNSDRVSMIVPGTREILPCYLHNVQAPMYITVCEEQSKLYVSEHEMSGDSNYLKIFDLK